MRKTWMILVASAALFIIGQPSIAGKGNETNSNQTANVEQTTQASTNDTVCTSETNTTVTVVYALRDLEGKRVRARVIDQETEKETVIGPYESPKEIVVQYPAEGGVYTVQFEVYDPETKKWVEEHRLYYSSPPVGGRKVEN